MKQKIDCKIRTPQGLHIDFVKNVNKQKAFVDIFLNSEFCPPPLT